MAIFCKICGVSAQNTEFYIIHIRLHRKHKSFEYAVDNCEVFFKNFSSYVTHLRHRHIGRKKDVLLECPLWTCTYECSGFTTMTKHVTRHIAEGNPVYCPLTCRTTKLFDTVNTLRIHNMYYHRMSVQKRQSCSHSSLESDVPLQEPAPEILLNDEIENDEEIPKPKLCDVERSVENFY